MAEKPKRNPKALHDGMSYGVCMKCKREFKLKRKTKHSKKKHPQGVCPECGVKSQAKKV